MPVAQRVAAVAQIAVEGDFCQLRGGWSRHESEHGSGDETQSKVGTSGAPELPWK